jgi:hypothetical protein
MVSGVINELQFIKPPLNRGVLAVDGPVSARAEALPAACAAETLAGWTKLTLVDVLTCMGPSIVARG